MLEERRIPGYKRDDLQLLPSSTTKKINYYKISLINSLSGSSTNLHVCAMAKTCSTHQCIEAIIRFMLGMPTKQ